MAPQYAEECVLSRFNFSASKYPKSCNLHCAWDFHPFKGKPWFAVIRKIKHRTTAAADPGGEDDVLPGASFTELYPKVFCSPGCRNSYLRDHAPKGSMARQLMLSHEMDVSLGLWPQSRMQPFAASPQRLAKVGGSMTLQQFRMHAFGMHHRYQQLPGRYVVVEGHGDFGMDTHITRHILVKPLIRGEDAREEMREMRRIAGLPEDDTAFPDDDDDDDDEFDGDGDGTRSKTMTDEGDDYDPMCADNEDVEREMGIPRSGAHGDEVLRRLNRMTEAERGALGDARLMGYLRQTLIEGVSVARRDQEVLRKAEDGQVLTADER